MSGPRRWKDAGAAPPGMRELLEAARPTRRMTASERRRTASRVANLVSVPVAASIAWVWAKGVAIAGVATLSVVTLAHVASGTRPADLWSGRSPSGRDVAPRAWAPVTLLATARALAPGVAARTSAPTPEEPTAAVPPPEQVATEPAPAEAPTAAAPGRSRSGHEARPAGETSGPVAPTPGRQPEDADVLAREANLLEAARAALAVEPARALALLDRYGQEFPRGQLAAERNVLRVDALRRLGRVDEAQADGRALLGVGVDSPHSGGDATLYAPRVRKLIDSPEAPERR